MKLGIDFGTTNSSVAMYNGADLHRLALDTGTANPYILPSLIYIGRDQSALVGTPAALTHLKRETGRPVQWERRRVGEIDFYGADLHYVQDVHVMVDAKAQGRLLQYVKTGLRDPSYEGTQIFDRYYTVDELIAIVLRHLKARAEEELQDASAQVVLGRPVKYSDDDAINQRAEEMMFKAARLAGFDDVRFELEPVGAAYAYHRAAKKRQTAFIFDFGGGTLDFTIARLGGKREPEILATHGVLVGGDDLDRRLMQSLRKYFGGAVLPDYVMELTDNWQTMPDLSRPAMAKIIAEFAPRDPRGVAALKTLVAKNVGFKLFRAIEQTKKNLSSSDIEQLDFDFENISIHKLIGRELFEGMIYREIEKVEQGVLQTLEIAGIRPEKLDIVLRTGGTSAVPVFTALLEKIFGAGRLAEMDLFTSVVGGLAVVAAEEGGVKYPYTARYDPHRVLRDVRVKTSRMPEIYRSRIDEKPYTDAEYTLARIPAEWSGLPAVKLTQADKAETAPDYLQFELLRRARVFIAYDAAATTLPVWLRAFEPQKRAVIVNQYGAERLLNIYAKDFPAGRVTLGSNRAEGASGNLFLNFVVVVQADPKGFQNL